MLVPVNTAVPVVAADASKVTSTLFWLPADAIAAESADRFTGVVVVSSVITTAVVATVDND